MSGRILVVTAGLLLQDDRILLAQRLPGGACGSLWELPGGKLEFGESPEDCLRRELAEELGLAVEVESLHGVFQQVVDATGQVLLLVYRCRPGPRAPEALECQDWRWVTPEQALAYPLAPLDRQILEQYSTKAPSLDH